MRIGLFTEGTYPVADGGVTRWCDLLVRSLPEHTFVPVTIIGHDERKTITTPGNVTEPTLIPMWSPARPTLLARRRSLLEDHLEQIWAAALPAGSADADIAGFSRALRGLTTWPGARLSGMLAARSSARALLAAWRAHRVSRPELPPLTLACAVQATAQVDRVLALADMSFPDLDMSHVAANGPSAVLALGRWWSSGTPILLTEHGIYLRERYLALAQTELSWGARRAVTAFLRVLSQTAYAEAALLTPVSDFNGRWEESLGAVQDRIRTIHNGVDTSRFQPIRSEPHKPTVSFVGRIDPLKDLVTLIEAMVIVRQRVPGVRLRVFGPVPEGNEPYRDSLLALISERQLNSIVTFEGPVSSAVPALEAGHVVALSSISEGLPFTVIEAMMSGRATVSTDVGGVSEVVGTDATCGLLVPPRDPAALANALTIVLTNRRLRAEMGRRARLRALRMFDRELFATRYRDAYAEVAKAPPPDWLAPPPPPPPAVAADAAEEGVPR